MRNDIINTSKSKKHKFIENSNYPKKLKIDLKGSKKKKVNIKYVKKCILISVLSNLFFALLFVMYLYKFLYGSIPWTELETWSNLEIYKEYSLPKIVKKLKKISTIEKLNLISPFVNGTFLKTRLSRYGSPVFELSELEKSCKHYINYDITIPPGGWIIYSSCINSLEHPYGYNSIRATGYPAYGNIANISSPLEVKEWYHGYYNHIQVPILVTE